MDRVTFKLFLTLLFLWLIFYGTPDLFDIFKIWAMKQAGIE